MNRQCVQGALLRRQAPVFPSHKRKPPRHRSNVSAEKSCQVGKIV